MKVANPLARRGEDIACIYLKTQGYLVIERNYRKKFAEIDIVAIDKTEKEKVLAFVEVKTRTNSNFGMPLESITKWKLDSLLRVAQYYKLTHRNLPDSLRIDAVSVDLAISSNPKVELIKNISGF